MYRCLKCKNSFDQCAWISYTEYAGASTQQEPVSPCCYSHYEDIEESEANERNERAIVEGEARYRASVLGDEA